MYRIKICLIFLLVTTSFVFSQVETIPADHPVYPFLKNMYLKGALSKYSDIVLPLSKGTVINYLSEIEKSSYLLSASEKEFLCRMEVKMGMKNENPMSFVNHFPSGLIDGFRKYSEKHLYSFTDSTAKFYVDLIGDVSYLYSDIYHDYSILLNAGGQLYGTYSDWLGFLLEGSNGTQYHNRQVAELDPRVKTSFTFNETRINFFDHTQGYLRLQKDAVNFELGRERILWGIGYVDRMVLSDNPPLFDFLKFHISYKSLRYDFIHAWLVQPFKTVFIDSITGDVKQKGSKYLAISRLGITPIPDLEFGISQMIIYANRPFEAAYLNPFLFWESAQRSLGDLDNSFLSFDLRYKIFNGFETSGSMIWDDILFSALFKGEFDKINNRSTWKAGVILADPILPSNTDLKIEYQQVRPFTFSHPGIGESLTYTNNTYLLGTNLQPNSTAISSEFNYLLNGNINFKFRYSHILHGRNIYDENGNLIKNVGGNILETIGYDYNTLIAPLLDGILETTDQYSFFVRDEIQYGLYLNLIFNYSSTRAEGKSLSQSSAFIQFNLYFR